MLVTSRINIDLRHPNAGVMVDAVQGDVNTRAVEISLFDGGAVWTVPSGVTAALAYKKPDSKQGCLDSSASVTVSGSAITIVMTKQMLATPGTVNACVVLTDASQNQLTSFPFSVSVAANPAADAQQSDEPVKVDTSDATAAAGDIAVGKTAYVDGKKVTGTHKCAAPNLQSKTVSPSESQQTVSPDSGYDGLSSVKVGAVSSTYVGSGVTKKSAATYIPGTSDQTIASGQYLSGKQTIKGDANLLAENIKSGVTVFGVNGTYAGTGGLDTSDATAAEDNIENGKTAYVNGEKITGSLTLLGSLTSEAKPGFIESTKKVKLTYTNDKKRLINVNGTIGLTANASNFGDATAEDVAAGKTFTSAAGLKVTGTNQGQAASYEICEVHPITIAGQVGNDSTIPLLTGNTFLAEHCNDSGLFVAFISLDNFTDKANRIHAIYQGNRPIATLNGNTNYGSFVTINSSTYNGKSWSNANCLLPINDAESFSATRLAVNESGDLNCYLPSSKYLDAGSYLAILVLAAA